MLNLLKDHISNSLPFETLVTNRNLPKKVDEKGNFLPFRGNTTVFLLDEGVKKELGALQDTLYEAAPEMLSARLDKETFHMTLHDLVNGEAATADSMARAEREARRVLQEFSREETIQMRGTWIFNMVDTSIVLGLEPRPEEGVHRLSDMYCRLESVVPLGYALTPHITLAYFRPGKYDGKQLAELRQVLKPAPMEVELHMAQLVLQNFTDMNHYFTLP